MGTFVTGDAEPRRELDPELFYPAQNQLEETFRQSREELSDALGFSPEHHAAREADFVALVKEIGFVPSTEGRRLYEKATAVELADARGVEPDPVLEQQRHEDGRRRLRETYGPDMVDRCKRFVASCPTFAARLKAAELENDPDVAMIVADHVHSSGWR